MRLMNFWVENHKNFKTKQGIFFTHEDGTPFTSVGVYGPNSGGKTNFLEACHSIVEGLQGNKRSYTPNKHASDQESTYAWTVEHNDRAYVYGYSIDASGITHESLEYLAASDYDNEENDDPDTVKIFDRDEHSKYGVDSLEDSVLLAYELLCGELLDEDSLKILKYLLGFFYASPENMYMSPKLLEDRGLTSDEVVATFIGAADGLDKPFGEIVADDLDELSPKLQEWVKTSIGVVSALYDGRFVIADDFGEGVHPELVYALLEGINNGMLDFDESAPTKQMIYATQNVAVMYHLARFVGLPKIHDICFIDRNHHGEVEIYDIYDFENDESRTHKIFVRYMVGVLGATPLSCSSFYSVW